MSKIHTDKYDIAVIGAGLVGMVVARCFAATGQRVLLLSKAVSKPSESGYYPLTLRARSHAFLQSIGFDLSEIQTSPIKTLNLSARGCFGSANIQEDNQKAMGVVMPVEALAHSVSNRILSDENITRMVTDIEAIEEQADSLILRGIGESWICKRCVLADGAHSNLSKQLPGVQQAYPQLMQSIILPIQSHHWPRGTALIRQDQQTVYGVVP